MPENATIEYNENLTSEEIDQLRELEPAVKAALQSQVILGRTRWTAKLDPSKRTIFALERITINGGMLTYYAAHELSIFKADEIHKHIFGLRHRYVEPLYLRPLAFEQLSSAQRGDIVNHRRNITILVPRSVTKLGNINTYPRSEFMPSHVEVPPTPVALTDSGTAQIMVHAPHGSEGAWQRLFMATYHEGGRIFFLEFDTQTIEAVFRFE